MGDRVWYVDAARTPINWATAFVDAANNHATAQQDIFRLLDLPLSGNDRLTRWVAAGKTLDKRVIEKAKFGASTDPVPAPYAPPAQPPSDIDRLRTDIAEQSAAFVPALGSLAPQVNRPRVVPPALKKWRLSRKALVGTGAGAWRSVGVGLGFDVVFDPATGRYTMLVAGYNGTNMTIGQMWSDDLFTWEEDPGSPVFLDNATAGQQDSGGVTFPQLHFENGTWHLFYIGFPTDGFEAGVPALCRATTTDSPANWTSASWTRQEVVLAQADVPWMAAGQKLYKGSVVKVGGTYHLFFNGGVAAQESIGHATASAIGGPYTADATALLTPTDFGDSGVADADVFRLGDDWFMLVWGSNGGGSILLAHTTAADFPNGWASAGVVVGQGGNYCRPVTVMSPDGLLMFASNGGSVSSPTEVDLFCSASAPARRAFDSDSKTDANVTVTSTAWTLAGPTVQVPALPGDLLTATAGFAWDNGAATDGHVDLVTVVAGAPVTSLPTEAAQNGTSQGAVAATGPAGRYATREASASYRVTAADIDGAGLVTVQTSFRTVIAGTRIVFASAATPLRLEVVNHGL